MVKIIGAGFGRTGTASIKSALEHLGFGPCYHMFEVIAEPERMQDWARALDGPVDWDQVLGGYESTVDWPGCTFWRELMAAYPDAKVLLTTRDPERWYDSTYNTIYQFVQDPPGDADDAFTTKLRPTIERMIWNGAFGGRFEDRAHAIEVFERHNAEVRAAVPADRLLEYQVGQGWEPLCDFFGVDVPAEDFPHINDSASIRDLAEKVQSEGKFPSPFTTA
ncbi:sulfotransferase family protein [Saccharopolyspora sp. NFXS83]|uniref:sulfotransferase family protein n=1 Tax=Saccharopolyspora sp. NFXS83 TaxID=2993560 RepID=UPI00224AF853|nr:sulfotransferase family protein [Saccharopolyspora sp. NFXS83]MCX2730268.1 sulfotransferase family protein [Saccharopolyspora sp. NFXS83]